MHEKDRRVLTNLSDSYFRDVSGAMDRATRIADRASEDLLRSECIHRTPEIDSLVFDADDVASCGILTDAIEHLVWRGLATRIDKSDEVEVILHDD